MMLAAQAKIKTTLRFMKKSERKKFQKFYKEENKKKRKKKRQLKIFIRRC